MPIDKNKECIYESNKGIKCECTDCNICDNNPSKKDLKKNNKDELIDDLNYILKENFEFVPLYKVINIVDELIKRGWKFDKK